MHMALPLGGPSPVPAPDGGLFDYLIRPREQDLRDHDAECLGGFQINDEIKLARLLNWKICRFFPFENPPDIGGGAPIRVGKIAAVANQTAADNIVSPRIDCRHALLRH